MGNTANVSGNKIVNICSGDLNSALAVFLVRGIFLVLHRDSVFGKCIGRILKSCVTSTSLVLQVHLDILVIQIVEKFSQQVL